MLLNIIIINNLIVNQGQTLLNIYLNIDIHKHLDIDINIYLNIDINIYLNIDIDIYLNIDINIYLNIDINKHLNIDVETELTHFSPIPLRLLLVCDILDSFLTFKHYWL